MSDFPTTLESVEALEFIGLSPQAAQEVFARFTAAQSEDLAIEPDLLDFALGHVEGIAALERSKLSDDEILTKVGIAEWLRKAILNPDHADVCGTGSLAYWVEDSFKMNYNNLEMKINKTPSASEALIGRSSTDGPVATMTIHYI